MKYLVINTAVNTEILLSLDNLCLSDNTKLKDLLSIKGISVNQGDLYFFSDQKSIASTQLLPILDKMLKCANILLNDLDFLACVIGPGSFTGIRVGVAIVRALAYALNKPIIPIIYFDVMTYNISTPTTIAIDGASGVCYIQNYVYENTNKSEFKQHLSQSPICIKNTDILKHSFSNIVANCDFLQCEYSLFNFGYLPLKQVVKNAFKNNNFLPYDKLTPLYLRRSQPEREAGEL